MKKICKNCMSQYEGVTCPLCAQTDAEGRPNRPASTAAEKRNQKIMLIVLSVFGVIFVIFMLYRNGTLGGRVYEEPINTYFESICARDFEGFLSVMPKEIADDYRNECESLGMEGDAYLAQLYADYFAEFGDDMKMTINFGEGGPISGELIDKFAEDYMEQYGVYPNAKAFRKLEAQVSFYGSNDSESIDVVCYLMRTKFEWYMVGCDYKDMIPV